MGCGFRLGSSGIIRGRRVHDQGELKVFVIFHVGGADEAEFRFGFGYGLGFCRGFGRRCKLGFDGGVRREYGFCCGQLACKACAAAHAEGVAFFEGCGTFRAIVGSCCSAGRASCCEVGNLRTASAAEHIGGVAEASAGGAGDKLPCRRFLLRLVLELFYHCLGFDSFGIQPRDAAVQGFQALGEGGVVLGPFVQACSQLGGKIAALLVDFPHARVDLRNLHASFHGGHAAVYGSLDVVKESHRSSSRLRDSLFMPALRLWMRVRSAGGFDVLFVLAIRLVQSMPHVRGFACGMPC